MVYTDRVHVCHSFFGFACWESQRVFQLSRHCASDEVFRPIGDELESEARHILGAVVMCNLAIEARLLNSANRLASAARALTAIGPQATLDRGYAIVSRQRDGVILTDAEMLHTDDEVRIRLARGETRARILAAKDKQ